MPTYSVFGDGLPSSRPARPQRRYCMEVGLYHPHGHKSDRWPPTSPAPSQSDREALGTQRFHLLLRAWSFGTSRPRYHHPLLPSLGAGQQGLPRWLVSHLGLWRPVYCSGWGWKTFHLDLRWMISYSGWGWKTFHLDLRWRISHSGWGWKTFHPGWRWILFRLDPGLVGLHPVTYQRLELPESQSGLTSVGEVSH